MNNVLRQAHALQRDNLAARIVYLIGIALTLVICGIVYVFDRDASIFVLAGILVTFFGGIALMNERLIRRMKRAGIDGSLE